MVHIEQAILNGILNYVQSNAFYPAMLQIKAENESDKV